MRKIVAVILACSLMVTLPFVFGGEKGNVNVKNVTTQRVMEETTVIVSKENPFYSLIATPAALFYDTHMHVKPLLVQDFSNPSKSIQQFKELYGIGDAILIKDKDIVEASIAIATQIWETSDEAMILSNDFDGYKLGVALAPLASYEDIPIFVANSLNEIQDTLESLNVQRTYVCENIGGYGDVVTFESMEEINNFMTDFVTQKFGGVNYIAMANPLDITKPNILDTTEYTFRDTVPSLPTLPAQSFNVLLTSLLGQDIIKLYEFEVPYDGYARIKMNLVNLDPENVKELGDRIFFMVMNPEGDIYAYTATGAGLAEYENGDIVGDTVHYEFIVCNEPGTYQARVMGQWFASIEGEYELHIKVEKIDTPIDPLMENLSSLAGYLAAYHQGMVFAEEEFAYAHEQGVSQPGDNPAAIESCNQHVMNLHSKLNNLLADIEDLPNDMQLLWQHYKENPTYIAIVADPTMIPMFFYKNPDDDYLMGWGVPGDFIYGNIDPNPADTENDTFTYYPFQENAVGRVTGYDVEDCSALIARTVFYTDIIEKLGEWKNTATVQTGCGLEFQWIPGLTTLSNLLSGGTDPTKWPTGESFFINLRLCNDLEEGRYTVKSTHLLSSQREGFEDLAQYGRKYLLFPHFYEAISGENVKGGEYQEESSIIFTFNHGFYYLYESGDVLLDARGFPPFTNIARFYPMGSGLSAMGEYDVRSVSNMDFGPSIVYIESCICGRTDGLQPENCLSQAYLHAGVNAFVAASRVTADPGYLEPGLLFEGFGAKGFVNATLNLKREGKYPHPHFGAVIAEDFILDLANNDNTTGIALRNAKNVYLSKDANSTFLWTPPLVSTGCSLIDQMIYESLNQQFEYGKYLDKKYHCLHEFNLYGDPAFNPWNP